MRSDANFQAVPKSVYYRGRAHRTKLKPFRPTDERQRGSMRQPATKESDCRLAGLKIEFQIRDEKVVVESPVGVNIPAGTPHTQRIVDGSGHFFNFVPKSNYNDGLM